MTGPWSEPPGTPRGVPSAPTHRSAPTGDGTRTVAIGPALERLLRLRGMEDAVVLGQVSACWEEIVGPEVARQVHPRLVRDGELVLQVDHPAWATELELAGPAVLSRLHEHLGEAAPKRLSVRVGPSQRR